MRKNILILGHNYATQFIDIYNQYNDLFDPEKYAVTVAYLTGEPNEEVRQRTHAKEVIFLNFSKKSIRGLKIGAIKKLNALCREKQFEMVICHRYKPIYIMMWVAQFQKIPVIINVMHELNTLSSLHRKCLINALARKNTLFAGVSNAVRDDMRKSLRGFFPEDRVVTLYNMANVAQTEALLLSREEARAALNLSNDAFVFGNLARLVRNKDQHSLIEAFATIKSQCPQAKLLLIGEGDLEATLKKQVAAHQLEQDILFTGFLPCGFRYMKAFDGFVLSSTQEAFGRVLLEAMIAKLPIIATETHGIPEVVGNTAVLVKPRHPQQLAQALQQLYSTPEIERKQRGEKAYQHVIEHFSVPVFRQQFWRLPFIQSLTE